mmetsp:Transcript_1179/g.1784  ORF Transcript_1179/g.1784 Transcript_1179/m.1784 type:complete len:343 (+) Transcript_1179:1369-2397(+)
MVVHILVDVQMRRQIPIVPTLVLVGVADRVVNQHSQAEDDDDLEYHNAHASRCARDVVKDFPTFKLLIVAHRYVIGRDPEGKQGRRVEQNGVARGDQAVFLSHTCDDRPKNERPNEEAERVDHRNVLDPRVGVREYVRESVAHYVESAAESPEEAEELGHIVPAHDVVKDEKDEGADNRGDQHDAEVAKYHAEEVLEGVKAEKVHHVAQAALSLLHRQHGAHARCESRADRKEKAENNLEHERDDARRLVLVLLFGAHFHEAVEDVGHHCDEAKGDQQSDPLSCIAIKKLDAVHRNHYDLLADALFALKFEIFVHGFFFVFRRHKELLLSFLLNSILLFFDV